MIEGPYFALTVPGVLGTGLVAGVFRAFSAFVMRGLAALPPARGVAVMQAINKAVVTPPFMVLFVGSALLCAVLAVVTSVLWPDEAAVVREPSKVVLHVVPSTIALLLGSGLHLIGSFGLTRVANVPRNDALARLDPQGPEAIAYWPGYVREWTAWNHVRTAASAGAAVSYIAALT